MRALDRPWDRWKDRNWRGGRSWVRRFLLPRGACANRIVGAYSIAACLATAQKAAGRERRQLAGCGSARTFDVRRVNTTLHRQQDAARKQRSGRQRMSASAAWPADADARSAMSDVWSRHQAGGVARRRARPSSVQAVGVSMPALSDEPRRTPPTFVSKPLVHHGVDALRRGDGRDPSRRW
jgi:hypothetical protein